MQTPFHAYYKAKNLRYDSKLLPAFASATLDVYPYQVAAASFALDSHFSRGVVLADEGSLGKTYEALLIISQKWFEGAEKILIVVPVHLLVQWAKVLDDNFNIPYSTENADEDGIYLATYESNIPSYEWDIACFDEAQRLRNDNETNRKLKTAVENSYKILLTPAPIMNDIMDLYHLINFIDKDEFPDPNEYYNRYFRQEDNYPELAERAGKYVFRTLKSQVGGYVNIPKRLVVSVAITPTVAELELHDKIVTYANKPFKKAYPKINNYDLMLMLTNILSSSTFAFAETTSNLTDRIQDEDTDDWERREIGEIANLASKIQKNAKITALMDMLPKLFALLATKGAKKKALIFVQNRATIKALKEIVGKKYKVLTFDGSKSRRHDIIEKFRDEAQVLITTDIANEGLNLEFCSCVINFDTSYNTLDIEQRILRCHRQNQQNDVLVVNLINRQNASDIRALGLYKKRIKQFAGIFGISDEIVGNFYDTDGALKFFSQYARDKAAIKQAFDEQLASQEADNITITEKSKTALFSTFDETISYTTTLTPEYVEIKRREMNDDLWYGTASLLDKQSGIWLNHDSRSIKAMQGIDSSPLFKRLYIRRDEYSMTDMTLPKSGRYTLTAKLAINVLHYIVNEKTNDAGVIYVNGIEPCTIEFYDITIKRGANWWSQDTYDFFEMVGKTADGIFLNDTECRKILSLPCEKFTEIGQKLTWQERLSYTYPKGDYQDMVDLDKHRNIVMKGAEIVEREALRLIKRNENNRKAEIKRKLQTILQEKQATLKQEAQVSSVHDRIKLDKKLAVIQDDLQKAESALFMEKMRIEYEAEQEIKKLLDDKEVSVEIKRIFKIQVRSEA
jgi:hypothetical protein